MSFTEFIRVQKLKQFFWIETILSRVWGLSFRTMLETPLIISFIHIVVGPGFIFL